MPHPFIETDHLKEIYRDRFPRDAHLLHGTVNLPDSAAVRAEVTAMLREVASDPPPPRPAHVPLTRRFRAWFPRWLGWLRAMPTP